MALLSIFFLSMWAGKHVATIFSTVVNGA